MTIHHENEHPFGFDKELDVVKLLNVPPVLEMMRRWFDVFQAYKDACSAYNILATSLYAMYGQACLSGCRTQTLRPTRY